MMREKLARLEDQAFQELKAASSEEAVLDIKHRYLGRKGEFGSLIKELSSLPADLRRAEGEQVNNAKQRLEREVERFVGEFSARLAEERLKKERIDTTLPGRCIPNGRVHPITAVMKEIEEIFLSLGFSIVEGPEVESDYYNFEALNIPKDHPARDMQDTFYLGKDMLLRTHTSPVQIRVMEREKPPLRVIAPGAVYRRDSDITHTPMFHQVEGFMVDKDVSFAHLKGTLTYFLNRLFGVSISVRFRPSFFPFTEPSAEVDIRCVMCKGAGCRVCKMSGWLEILGCGMIHPNVFRSVKYDPKELSGFAFGLGVERVAMLKYGIDDIRLFFENDVRFLRQF